MENIVIVEKLCEKLQESDRPTDLGVAIALRVILDENITIDELRAETVSNYGRTLKRNSELVVLYHKSEAENSKLKEANNILTVEIKQANALIALHKMITKYRVPHISHIQDFTLGKKACKPVQTSIQFPANIPTVSISEEEKQKSIYYKSAIRRSAKIWKYVHRIKNRGILANLEEFVQETSHIVNWSATFHIAAISLYFTHIEAACMPKCYGGLGIAVGMELEKWVDSQIKTR